MSEMIAFEEQEETLLVTLSGDIDHHIARDLRIQIDEEVTRLCPQVLCLDFREVTFMDSSGIGLVMGRYKLIQSMGGTLQVVNLSSHIRRVMILAGLDKLAIIR